MYKFDLLERNNFLELENKGEKIIYNTDSIPSLKGWIKNNKTPKKFPTFQSALNIKKTNRSVGTPEGFLGTLVNDSNNVKSQTNIFILSGGITSRTGKLYFFDYNFSDCCSIFCARTVVNSNWINGNDEYLVPNTNHHEFPQFKLDSIIYSIFNSSSQQSSLRQISYENEIWDIKNEFFWMSVDKMKEFADRNGYDELYNDARTSSDRYVYKLLFGEEKIYDKLSPDAKAVLDKATELVERSMELRQVMANEENHLNSWDAGYAQLKLCWKEYFQDEFKEFRQLYKNLEERMRPLVYELGFLKK